MNVTLLKKVEQTIREVEALIQLTRALSESIDRLETRVKALEDKRTTPKR